MSYQITNYQNYTDHQLQFLATIRFGKVLRPLKEIGRKAVIEELIEYDVYVGAIQHLGLSGLSNLSIWKPKHNKTVQKIRKEAFQFNNLKLPSYLDPKALEKHYK